VNIRRISGGLAALVSIILFVNLIIALIISSNNNVTFYQLNKARQILILAAHQDDCVIQAGGLAILNIRLGGTVDIVYLTRPVMPAEAAVRKIEADNSWQYLHSSAIHLKFLDYYSVKNWTDKAKTDALTSIIAEIERVRPDLVVIPLKEGGNPEHDLLNTLSREALASFPDIEVLQAAEYNPYYIMSNTPTKILWFLAKMIPFIDHKDPNYGLLPKNQQQLAMSDADLTTKIKMIEIFKSQAGVISTEQFGYPDLFDSTTTTPDDMVALRLKGKLFSPWAVFTISFTFIMLWMWGIAAYFNLGRPLKALLFIVLVLIAAYILLVGHMTRCFESFYMITLIFGLLSGRALQGILQVFHKKST
jgi:LmbE family N-acetylglucosaminyl deacetylase